MAKSTINPVCLRGVLVDEYTTLFVLQPRNCNVLPPISPDLCTCI